MRLRLSLIIVSVAVALTACKPAAPVRARALFDAPMPRPVGIAALEPEEASTTSTDTLCAQVRPGTYEQGSAQLLVDDATVGAAPAFAQGIGPNGYEEYCWTGVLDPGMHVADLRLKLIASQQFQTYSWSFEISE